MRMKIKETLSVYRHRLAAERASAYVRGEDLNAVGTGDYWHSRPDRCDVLMPGMFTIEDQPEDSMHHAATWTPEGGRMDLSVPSTWSDSRDPQPSFRIEGCEPSQVILNELFQR